MKLFLDIFSTFVENNTKYNKCHTKSAYKFEHACVLKADKGLELEIIQNMRQDFQKYE